MKIKSHTEFLDIIIKVDSGFVYVIIKRKH